jgi:hypothetical protein
LIDGNLLFPDTKEDTMWIATHFYFLEKYSLCKTFNVVLSHPFKDEGRQMPLQVPYEDITKHLDNYYDTNHYRSELVVDPFEALWM